MITMRPEALLPLSACNDSPCHGPLDQSGPCQVLLQLTEEAGMAENNAKLVSPRFIALPLSPHSPLLSLSLYLPGLYTQYQQQLRDGDTLSDLCTSMQPEE
jgi:hypothetical protein